MRDTVGQTFADTAAERDESRGGGVRVAQRRADGSDGTGYDTSRCRSQRRAGSDNPSHESVNNRSAESRQFSHLSADIGAKARKPAGYCRHRICPEISEARYDMSDYRAADNHQEGDTIPHPLGKG